MSALSTLKLVAVKKPHNVPVIQLRRQKLSKRIWEQQQLAQSQISGTPFAPTRFRSVVDRETGERKQVEMPKRIKAWWFVAENGKVCISIKYGSLALELSKGKSSVEVNSPEELINALDVIRKAVDAGELDSQIQQASSSLRSSFKR